MPWQWQEYQMYKAREAAPSHPAPHPTAHHSAPVETVLHLAILPKQHTDPQPVVYIIVHLPKSADMWIEDRHMIVDNQLHEDVLISPPLEKGVTYVYHFRVRWFENGKWVNQMTAREVKVGDVVTVDVVPHDARSIAKAVAAGLSLLNPADKNAAEIQKFCAVQQSIRLGSMGKPVKITINGKDVFLCCEGCRKAAMNDPEKTLQAATKLRENK